jgi:hypothetical protein
MTLSKRTVTEPVHPTLEYWLREDVYCGDAGEAFVFLDLNSERYFALSRDAGDLPETWIPQSSVVDAPLLQVQDAEKHAAYMCTLIRHGLVTERPSYRTLGSTYFRKPTSTVDCAESTDEFVWKSQFVSSFVFSYLTQALKYRFTAMKSPIAQLRRRKLSAINTLTVPTVSQLNDLMGHYLRLRAFTFTSKNRCVLDSLILCDYLLRNNVPPTFVIGVTLRPFRAHCWVQSGEVAMNYSHELIELYAPVLVI